MGGLLCFGSTIASATTRHPNRSRYSCGGFTPACPLDEWSIDDRTPSLCRDRGTNTGITMRASRSSFRQACPQPGCQALRWRAPSRRERRTSNAYNSRSGVAGLLAAPAVAADLPTLTQPVSGAAGQSEWRASAGFLCRARKRCRPRRWRTECRAADGRGRPDGPSSPIPSGRRDDRKSRTRDGCRRETP
jgi:hypothetical protein